MVSCGKKIIEGLCRHPADDFAVSLHEKGLISTEEMEHTFESKPDFTKARYLYIRLLRAVRCDPKQYDTFIAILGENQTLHKNLLKDLQSSRTHCKKANRFTHACMYMYPRAYT